MRFTKKLTYRFAILLCIIWTAGTAQLQKEPFYQTSVFAGPVLSFYSPNTNHTSGMKSGPAFTLGFRGNFRLNKTAKFFIGAQYMIHSNSFISYYFKDSTLQLYDKEFEYTYQNRFHDLLIPAGLHVRLGYNKQKKSSFFTELNWAYKYRFQSNMQINSTLYGFSVYDGTAGSEFRLDKMLKKSANVVCLGFGFDKNFYEKKSGFFFLLNYSYTLNTFYFKRTNNMPRNLFQIESFLNLSAGLRF